MPARVSKCPTTADSTPVVVAADSKDAPNRSSADGGATAAPPAWIAYGRFGIPTESFRCERRGADAPQRKHEDIAPVERAGFERVQEVAGRLSGVPHRKELCDLRQHAVGSDRAEGSRDEHERE